MDGYEAGTYGDGLADVYDDWYADVSPVEDTVAFLSRRGDGPVLELGSGTGRLAGPLAAAGMQVIGLDASVAMLRRARTRDDAAIVLAADMARPPLATGSIAGVFVAFNTLFNVPTRDGQQQVFDDVARLLRPGGWFVVEAFVPVEAPDDRVGRNDDRIEVGRMDASSVTLRVSRTDHDAQTVIGHFVELRDGEPVRLRPWSVRYAAPSELDAMASLAGLTLAQRHADWSDTPFDDDAPTHVSVYRKSADTPPNRQ